jgi:alpha-beta hydrolase superfamily lysophospholipase
MPRSEEMRFSAGEATLAGTLTLPDEPPPDERRGRYPTVLLLPSYLARDRDGSWDRARHPAWFVTAGPDERSGLLARLADALARRGVASLRYDKRGCGASDGDWQETALFTLIDDARDALGALRSRDEVDLRRTGIAGHGEGAAIAMSVAIGDPAIGALCLIGPAARGFRDVLRRGVASRSRTGGDRRHRLVAAIDGWSEDLIERADRREARYALWLGRGETLDLRLAGWEQAFRTPPIALATMLHRSVALVHGADDVWVDPDEAALLERVLRAGGNEPWLRLVLGAGHDLAEAADEVIDEVAADLAARLQPRELPPVLLAIENAE